MARQRYKICEDSTFVIVCPCGEEIPFCIPARASHRLIYQTVIALACPCLSLTAKRNDARCRMSPRGKDGRRGGTCRCRGSCGRRPSFPFSPVCEASFRKTRKRCAESPTASCHFLGKNTSYQNNSFVCRRMRKRNGFMSNCQPL